MPQLRRPDGVEIHWEVRGDGPLVAIVHQMLWSYPDVYADLIADLARDHRVLTYDPRGCGPSTAQGPYEPRTDAGDLEAVLDAAGGTAVAMAVGYGFNVVARVAAARADLIEHVLGIAPAAAAILPRSELRSAGVMAASDSVMDVLTQMMVTEPRVALSTVIATTNPELDAGAVRERVDRVAAYLTAEAAMERVRAWLDDDVTEYARPLGDRLSLLHSGTEALFEGALMERVVAIYPRARIAEAADGPISRPDITAARVRQLVATPS